MEFSLFLNVTIDLFSQTCFCGKTICCIGLHMVKMFFTCTRLLVTSYCDKSTQLVDNLHVVPKHLELLAKHKPAEHF